MAGVARSVPVAGLGDGIVAFASERVAFAETAQGQERAPDRPVFLERLERIGRACRLKAAVVADPGRKDQTVGAHGQGNDMGERRHFWAWSLRRA